MKYETMIIMNDCVMNVVIGRKDLLWRRRTVMTLGSGGRVACLMRMGNICGCEDVSDSDSVAFTLASNCSSVM